MTLADRFWSKVDRSGDCWTWTAAKNAKGYGRFGLNGRNRYAHQVAWELVNGRSFPCGMVTLHVCDNPACVNPDHLKAGTVAENNADCIAKGHISDRRGENNGRAKLTEDDVRLIRSTDESPCDIADRFCISLLYVYQIRSGGTWEHVK